eukprot:7385522-Prymnesium_polylepis.1
MAEFHWPQMRALLEEYVNETRPGEAERLKDPANARILLIECSHVVVAYFDARVVNMWATVLREVLRYEDAWWRVEFAKGRGAAHAHGLASSSHAGQAVARCFNEPIANLYEADREKEREHITAKLWAWMADAQPAISAGPGFQSFHPDPDGEHARDSEEVKNVLKTTVLQAYATGAADGRETRRRRLARRVSEHKCTLTCLGPLRRLKARPPLAALSGAAANASPRSRRVKKKPRRHFRKRVCRFNFGEYDEEL